jgi:hypothetical protein
MSPSMHAFTQPVFVRALRNLQHVLNLGEQHAKDKGIAPEVLLQSRLIADMLPLVRQVQIATDMAKNGVARLAGVDPLAFPDEETTFEQLGQRIAKAIAYIESFEEDALQASESREIVIRSRNGELNFDGYGYLTTYVFPNLYFHCSVAYSILRVAGAPLGKKDFMGDAGR